MNTNNTNGFVLAGDHCTCERCPCCGKLVRRAASPYFHPDTVPPSPWYPIPIWIAPVNPYPVYPYQPNPWDSGIWCGTTSPVTS